MHDCVTGIRDAVTGMRDAVTDIHHAVAGIHASVKPTDTHRKGVCYVNMHACDLACCGELTAMFASHIFVGCRVCL